jgi:hypothetical protein
VQCRDCQALVLDAAYGLATADQAAAAVAHAAACPACTVATAGVAREQRLFAAAAKMSFPEIVFVAPVDVATPARRVARSYTPWAIAASVVIVAGASLAMMTPDRPPVARVEVVKPVDGPTGRGLIESGTPTDPPPVTAQPNTWEFAAPGEPAAFTVKVAGHDALTLGVPNEYSIVVTQPGVKRPKFKITVTLTDASGAVLFTKLLESPVVLLPVKDAATKTLHVKVVDAKDITAEWKTDLKVSAAAVPPASR